MSEESEESSGSGSENQTSGLRFDYVNQSNDDGSSNGDSSSNGGSSSADSSLEVMDPKDDYVDEEENQSLVDSDSSIDDRRRSKLLNNGKHKRGGHKDNEQPRKRLKRDSKIKSHRSAGNNRRHQKDSSDDDKLQDEEQSVASAPPPTASRRWSVNMFRLRKQGRFLIYHQAKKSMDQDDTYRLFITKFPYEFVGLNSESTKFERCKSIQRHYVEFHEKRRMTNEPLSDVFSETDWSCCESTHEAELLTKSHYSNSAKRTLIAVLLAHLAANDVINAFTIITYIKILLYICGERHLLHVDDGGKVKVVASRKTPVLGVFGDSHVIRLFKKVTVLPFEWTSVNKSIGVPVIPFNQRVLRKYYPDPRVDYRQAAGATIGEALEYILQHSVPRYTGILSILLCYSCTFYNFCFIFICTYPR